MGYSQKNDFHNTLGIIGLLLLPRATNPLWNITSSSPQTLKRRRSQSDGSSGGYYSAEYAAENSPTTIMWRLRMFCFRIFFPFLCTGRKFDYTIEHISELIRPCLASGQFLLP
jgi:hypothetical protein